MKLLRIGMTPEPGTFWTDLGLLCLRVGVGLMMAFAHGLSKLQTWIAPGPVQWADPIGIGPSLSLFLAAGAEFFCSLLLVLGLFTRMAAVPLMVTMAVAVFVVHSADPWAKKEFGLLYLVPYLTLFFAGAGRYSIDAMVTSRR